MVQQGETEQAYALLAPVLGERTPFRLLDRIGAPIGAAPLRQVNRFLDRVAAERTQGGWVVIASALHQQAARDLAGAFARCRNYILAADIWYATDTLGERVPGPALVADLLRALRLLAPWRQDENRWVRRTVGVAVHYWAKRSHGAPEQIPHARKLLDLLEPMFEERDLDTVKGVGWGLKTMGRYYPALATEWLEKVVKKRRAYRALMLNKALTYLPRAERARVLRAAS